MTSQPVFELKQHWMATSVLAGGNGSGKKMSIRVYQDRVECNSPGAFSKGSTETIRWDQVAQVVIQEGVAFNGLTVETNGGGGFSVTGFNKGEVQAAKEFIDNRLAEVGATSASSSTGTALASEIAALADLHSKGVLSDDEFAAAKARLFL
jgi:hypothetical protein